MGGPPPAGTLMHPHHPQTQDILHDNIVALNDVDLNDESATSDLATSFFGYRWATTKSKTWSLHLMQPYYVEDQQPFKKGHDNSNSIFHTLC